jgi:hypothetical protein
MRKKRTVHCQQSLEPGSLCTLSYCVQNCFDMNLFIKMYKPSALSHSLPSRTYHPAKERKLIAFIPFGAHIFLSAFFFIIIKYTFDMQTKNPGEKDLSWFNASSIIVSKWEKSREVNLIKNGNLAFRNSVVSHCRRIMNVYIYSSAAASCYVSTCSIVDIIACVRFLVFAWYCFMFSICGWLRFIYVRCIEFSSLFFHLVFSSAPHPEVISKNFDAHFLPCCHQLISIYHSKSTNYYCHRLLNLW